MSRTYSVSDSTDALREYFSEHDIWGQAKIVFVCHSMGGIVVRRFLVANQARLGKVDPTLGLFLVASPSLGSRDANLLSTLSYALQHTQAAMLRFTQSNTTLDDLNRDFRTLLNSGDLTIVGRELLEDQPIMIKRWLGLRRQVVEPFAASAFFNGEGYEPLRIPGSDHSTIARPGQRAAMQHQALLRFLSGIEQRASAKLAPRAPTPTPHQNLPGRNEVRSQQASEAASASAGPGNEVVIRAALSIKLKPGSPLPLSDEGLELKAEVCLQLRSGHMLERMLATALLRRYAEPAELLMNSAERATSEREFELIAPWLRWIRDPELAESTAKLFEEKIRPGFVDMTRMRARMLGWAGERLFPNVNWDDNYNKEKFSFAYLHAYARSSWSNHSETSLRTIVTQLMNMHDHYLIYYRKNISIFDWISAFKGVPASNSKVLLNEMIRENAPSAMIVGLLIRMSVEPAKDALTDLEKLANHVDPRVRDQALETLAYVPAQSQMARDLKETLHASGSVGDVIAAGVDLRQDAIEDLGALLISGEPGKASYFAAWSLGQMASQSDDAIYQLEQGARESADKLTRAACIVGLAASGSTEAAAFIEAELVDSRDIETFCLLVARTYIDDVVPLLRFLAETSEDRIYVPYMLVCFQRMFCDALRYASQHAPILKELLTLTDDT